MTSPNQLQNPGATPAEPSQHVGRAEADQLIAEHRERQVKQFQMLIAAGFTPAAAATALDIGLPVLLGYQTRYLNYGLIGLRPHRPHPVSAIGPHQVAA